MSSLNVYIKRGWKICPFHLETLYKLNFYADVNKQQLHVFKVTKGRL